TAIAILDCSGDPSNGLGAGEQNATFKVLGNALLSQIEMHEQYGGVFPALAKREHAKNLVPILGAALEEAELLHENAQAISEKTRANISEMLAREPGLSETFFEFASECEPPKIDAIAVTAGPGLEPALWVGINFARALALLWDKPLVAVNHMEGHVMAALASERSDLNASSQGLTLEILNVTMPVLALLISGGHTELILMKEWLAYELIGQTRDDAVGEAFDKVARMLGLPYPGGPEISRLAEEARMKGFVNPSFDEGFTKPFILPRPMIDSGTCDFSFAGLKTSVLYLLKKNPDLKEKEKQHIAHEFENAVTDVLWKKTAQALRETGARTLVVGGGVSANTHIRRVFREQVAHTFPTSTLRIPVASLTTDNAVMIALAAFYRAERREFATDIAAEGNLPLAV
ncbi:MAG: tRNA (adenosine(37)-N6)-threonylcarbamoyltransferase complex transferase subunit TsaD, partial [bacterium]|nr:tRNA (adenosine(37)-N6)-threonylcarbamoyltransferase complex transferase subunit TsaD [bacterium]